VFRFHFAVVSSVFHHFSRFKQVTGSQGLHAYG
jgi:hypothetical protein